MEKLRDLFSRTPIDDGDEDNIVSPGQSLTYTVTFDEDVDFSSVGLSEFGNAGTSPLSIDAITEPSPGVLSVGGPER